MAHLHSLHQNRRPPRHGFDPDGAVAPTDRCLPGSAAEAGWRPAASTLLLAAVCCVAVAPSQP
ncbi:hypothetical protein [Streptomyces pseudoechinosporeus]